MFPDKIKNFDYSLLDSPDFKEDSVREELIVPIFTALGYKASGKNRIIRSKALAHPIVQVGSGTRQITSIPDYLLEVNGKYICVLDAKAPEEEIKSGKHREQAYFYSLHPDINVRLYALCNGREFTIFRLDEQIPILSFSLSDIDSYWKQLESILSPENYQTKKSSSKKLDEEEKSEFDYLSKKIPTEIAVKKQAARRHFGVHGYFTKQAWNVVQEYIRNFTQPGDTVLDPFGGSGVTVVEALMTGRKGINIDLNPLAVFLVQTLITPINTNDLREEFNNIKSEFEAHIPSTKIEIENALKKYSYPKGIRLPKGSDVPTIEKLFNPRQLAQLAYLRHLIMKVKDVKIRDSLRLSFSSAITMFNLTYHSSTTRGDMGGDTAAFRYYRYRIAPRGVELDLMKIFENKINKIINAKIEMQPIITEKTISDAVVVQGSATDLHQIPDESIDYIYTDPPYGSKIPYLDLSVMWNAWLDLPVTEEDYQAEAIEGGEHKKTKQDYSDLLAKSIEEMYRVLKFNRWMSFVFAHKDPAYWHIIVQTAEKVGFEYAGAVKQSGSQDSFKKRQNPFTVLAGQLIINFKKVSNPDSIIRKSLGANIFDVVLMTIEATIAKHDGATLEQINDSLIIRGLEMGFLDILSKEYKDLTPILQEHFEYNAEEKKFHIVKNTKFKTKIDLELRIRYFLYSYLKRMQIEKENPTFDEIILHIMPLLKNGITPEKQTIQNVLTEIAERVGEGKWRLKTKGQLSMFL